MKWSTTHAEIVESLLGTYPRTLAKGFNREIARALPGVSEPPLTRRVPDAFAFYGGGKMVDIFEVEVTSGLTEAALADYAALVVDLSFYDIEARLFVVNRFGHINEVDTIPWYRPCKH